MSTKAAGRRESARGSNSPAIKSIEQLLLDEPVLVRFCVDRKTRFENIQKGTSSVPDMSGSNAMFNRDKLHPGMINHFFRMIERSEFLEPFPGAMRCCRPVRLGLRLKILLEPPGFRLPKIL